MRKALPALVLIALFLVGSKALPQSPTASITGIVFDSDNKVIPGAEIIVVNDLTRVQYETKTNGEGIYTVVTLPPGPYRVQVSKIDFKTIIKPDITLNVGDALALNFTLPVGASSVSVTVEGGAPMINTQSATLSTVVDHNFVENMPLNGRSFQSLILLAPGVITTSPQVGSTTGQSGEFSVNGQRTESNYYTVDGVSANGGVYLGDPGFMGASGSLPAATALGTTHGLLSVDALQEFRVETSTYSAENGRNPGGQFSFVTRSGSNEWHGTAFEYLRNNFFDANDWFNDYYGLPEPAERQNDFGGTLGGPVTVPDLYNGKGRTFFFFSYEGLRLIQPQPALATYVPDDYVRTCTAGGLKQVMDAFPLPTAPGAAPDCSSPNPGTGQAAFVGSWSNPSNIDAVSIRLDHSMGEKLKLFFRFANTPSNAATRSTTAASEVDTRSFAGRTYTFGGTSIFSNLLSNEFRLNYSSNSANLSSQLDGFGGATPVNLAQLQGVDTSAYPDYEVFVGMFFGNAPEIREEVTRGSQRQWNFVDAVSWPVGRHQLRAGIDYRRLAPFTKTPSPNVAYYYYSQDSVVTNNADSALAESYAAAYPLYTNFSSFVQDEWHLTSQLVLSMGLRWDINPAPGVTQGYKPYTLDGTGHLSTATLAPPGTPLYQTDWYGFAPRLGAAYNVRRTPGEETVIRGGAGIYYDTAQQLDSIGFEGIGFSAYCVPQYASGCPLEPTAPFPLSVLSTPPAIANPPVAPYSNNVFPANPHLELPYTIQTNLSVDQALGRSQAFTVSYVGAFGRKLLDRQQVALSAVNPNFLADGYFLENGISSDYNAFQAQFRRRLSAGFQVLASYTYSHCIDYGSENSSYIYKRGNCDYDVRHNFNSALSYELPSVFQNRVARSVLHEWGIDAGVVARTGFPVSLMGNCAVDPTSHQVQCLGLDLVAGQPLYLYGSQYPGGRSVNVNAFAEPAPNEPGDAPRNFVRGFGAWQTDFAVRREFRLYERLKLQFRAEAFNLFNHPNFGYINSYFFPGSTTFGQAVETLAPSLGGLTPLYQMGGPRSMQFALKLIF